VTVVATLDVAKQFKPHRQFTLYWRF